MLHCIKHIPKDKVKRAVVFLHGYGSNGSDFSSLIYEFSRKMKDAVFYSPDAPEPMAGAFYQAYQWFPIMDYDPEALKVSGNIRRKFEEFSRLAEKSKGEIGELLDFIEKEHSLDPGKVAVLGFSQGGLMAALSALSRERALGAVVCFSAIAPVLGKAESKPPMMIIHGDADQVVPVEAVGISQEELLKAGIKPKIHIEPMMDHSINANCQKAALEFLLETIGRKD